MKALFTNCRICSIVMGERTSLMEDIDGKIKRLNKAFKDVMESVTVLCNESKQYLRGLKIYILF